MKKIVEEFVLGHLFFRLQALRTMLSQNDIEGALKEIESLEAKVNELNTDINKNEKR
jgi:uncharacterized protein YoxC